MKINILTLFPEMFNVLNVSILGRAVEKGILSINVFDIRDYTEDKHNRVDDTPFGGGCGMVMFPQPIFSCLNSIKNIGRAIYMSPRGKMLDKNLIEELSKEEELTILCGHYEGVDERVLEYFNMEEVSTGDYVLTGGEIPAMTLIDCVARFIPGVLGDINSCLDESIYSGLLEYDQYTKPREYEGLEVPDVLFSGNHEEIHLWQYRNSLEKTKKNRPDLFEKYLEKDKELSKKEKKILDEVRK